MIKSLSTGLFCVALICYALPWRSSVVGDRAFFGGATGIHLVTGTSVSEKGPFGIEVKRRGKVEPFAVFSFLAVLGGAAAGFVKYRKGLASAAAAGALAVVLLFMLQWQLGRETRGFSEPELRFGYYLVLLLSAGAAGLNLYAMMVSHGSGELADELAERKLFRRKCGAANAGDDRFCRNCGSPLA